jgi:hypothetical protein
MSLRSGQRRFRNTGDAISVSAANFARAPHCGHQRSVNHPSRSGPIARIAASIHQG